MAADLLSTERDAAERASAQASVHDAMPDAPATSAAAQRGTKRQRSATGVQTGGGHALVATDGNVALLPSAAAMQRRATIASHLLVAATLVLVMWQGLLAGLLCICLGFLATRWFSPRIGTLMHTRSGHAPELAAGLVILIPVVLLALAVPRTRSVIIDAPAQYQELLAFLAQTVLELRDKLPPEIAIQLPDGAADIQHSIATYLISKAGKLATAGRSWFVGLVLAFIGLLIGALAAIRPSGHNLKPLAAALHERVFHFGRVFTQIVAAQFWIALLNTSLTAIFLLVVMPMWQGRLPYTTALLVLTFVAGLIPIIGNLICNTVLTLVGLSVSLPVAIACLAFLMAIHKLEYFINAKIIGTRTHMGAWELLTVMLIMEGVFGAAGLVAAPLFYAYAKLELEAGGWV